MRIPSFTSLALALLVVGCSHPIRLEPSPVELKYLPRVESSGPVQISIDSCEEMEKISFFSNLEEKHVVNCRDLMGAVRTVAMDILSQNRIEVREQASKKIHYGIKKIDPVTHFSKGTVRVNLEVTAGENIKKVFQGEQFYTDEKKVPFALESSLTDAVAQSFEDPDIRAYLKRNLSGGSE